MSVVTVDVSHLSAQRAERFALSAVRHVCARTNNFHPIVASLNQVVSFDRMQFHYMAAAPEMNRASYAAYSPRRGRQPMQVAVCPFALLCHKRQDNRRGNVDVRW